MATFHEASALDSAGEHGYSAHIPDGWQQGRGAFGGLVLGVLLRAMERDEPDRRRSARSLQGDLCGPVPVGPVEVRVRLLRRGHNQSNLAAELTLPGSAEVLATANAVLSPARTDHAHDGFLPPPPPSDWRALPLLPVQAPRAPVFAQNYHYRDAGSNSSLVTGWIQEASPPQQLDAPSLLGLLDAWWPTLFHLEGVPRPIVTIGFSAGLLCDPASLPAGEPLRYRAQMAGMRDGFFVEQRELWHQQRPVAFNQQTFAILK